MAIRLQILPNENLALFTYSGIVTEEDYAEALEIYATHPDAGYGQNLICDMRRVRDGSIDMEKRLALQVSLDKMLGAGGLPRKIIYLADRLPVINLIMPCVALWAPHPSVTGEVVNTQEQAIAALGLSLSALPEPAEEVPA